MSSTMSSTMSDTMSRTAPASATTASPTFLHTRARSLRRQAQVLPHPVAVAYRRRASELEFTAFLLGHQLDRAA